MPRLDKKTGKFVPTAAELEKKARLETENAMLLLELADTQRRLSDSEKAHADLLATLVLGGVL